MAINPAMIFGVGRQVAQGLSSGAKSAVRGGIKVNQFLTGYMENAYPAGQLNPRIIENPSFPMPPKMERNIHLLRETAEKLGDMETAFMLKDITRQVSNDFYQILFAGHFSSGKSTLLNTLIERPLLPVAVMPTTKTLTWLLYGEKEEAYSQNADDILAAVPFENIMKIDEGQISNANSTTPLNLFAFMPAAILKNGVVLIDSAGLDDPAEFDAPLTTQITLEAVTSVDAVVLVVDAQFGLAEAQKNFIEYLKNNGKGRNLFVVINKMDLIEPPEQRKDVAREFVEILTSVGVSSNIYPLSSTEPSVCDYGLAHFRDALVTYMQNDDLRRSRQATIESRIQSISSGLLQTCKKMEELSKLSDGELAQKRKANELEIAIKRGGIEKMIRHNRRELINLGETIKINWVTFFVQLKDYVDQWINNAADYEQIARLNTIQGNLQVEINKFLAAEFESAAEKVCKETEKELQTFSIPAKEMPQFQLSLKQHGWFEKLPAGTGSTAALMFVFSKVFLGHGIMLFKMIGAIPNAALVFMMAPIFDHLFKSVQNIVKDVSFSSYKKKIAEKFDAQFWPELDKQVRVIINDCTAELGDHVETALNETMRCLLGTQQQEMIAMGSINNDANHNTQNIQQSLQRIIQGGV
jgi:small GTP-binding protein